MGEFANTYKQIIVENNMLKEQPVPDRATDSENYFQHRIKVRAAERKIARVRDCLCQAGLTLGQLSSALETVIGHDKTEEMINEIRKSSPYRNRMLDFLRSKHPELVQELGNNTRAFISSNANFTTTVSRWIEEGKLTPQERDSMFTETVIQDFYELSPADEMAFAEVLEQSLTQEQQERFLNAYNSEKDVNDYSKEEKTVGTYDERIGVLRANIPQDISSDPAKLEEYNNALDYASAHLNVMKPEVRSEVWAREQDCQSIEAGKNNIANSKIPEYEGGKFHNIYDESKAVMDIIVVEEDRVEDINTLINTPIEFSEKTKEGLRRIYAKMDEMNLMSYPFDPKGEDGNKVYALSKLSAEKTALENALNAGNPDDIIKAQKAYEKTVNDMNELYSIAKEYFNDNPVEFPGNMDSIRNVRLPFEFTGDIKTTAQINGAFITYTRLKQGQMNVEDYLNDPSGTLVRENMDKLKAVSFAEVSKNLSFEDSVGLLSDSGRFKYEYNKLDQAVPLISFGRQLGLPASLEGDAGLVEKNRIVYEALFGNLTKNIGSERSKFSVLSGKTNNGFKREQRTLTLQKLIVASDEERNVNAMIGSLPPTDHLGRVIGENFDHSEAIGRNPVDYTGMMDRAEKLLKIAFYTREGSEPVIDPGEVIEAIQKVYIDVLTRHPEDAESFGFRRMQEDLKNLPARVPSNVSDDIYEKIESLNKSFFNGKVFEADKNPAWKVAAYGKGFKTVNVFPAIADIIDDQAFKDEYQDRLMVINEAAQEYGEDPNNPQLIENPRYYNGEGMARMPFTKAENNVLKLANGIAGNDAIRAYESMIREMKRRLRRQASGYNDEKAKRRIEDSIYLLDADDVKTVTYYATTAFAYALETQKMDMVTMSGEGYTPDVVRKELGSFYDDQMDLAHYAVDELRVSVEHQEKLEKLQRSGKTWSDADEKEYADKIRNAHNNYLRSYDRLRQVTDPSLVNNPRQQNGGFDEIMDRTPDFTRGISGQAGWLRGELKALENGWSTDELAILGAIGNIEATIENRRRYASKARKEGLEDFAKDFSVIRDKYWNKHIENNADKKEVCDELMAFVEKHADCKFGLAFSSCYEILFRVSNEIKKEAAETEIEDAQLRWLKDHQPVEYLKILEQSGDIRKFVCAIADIHNRNELNLLSEEEKNKFENYYGSRILGLTPNGQPELGWDFVEKYHKELQSYLVEQSVYYYREVEKTAREIREGRHAYSEALGDLGKDHKASMEIAKLLVGYSSKADGIGAARQMLTRVEMTYDGKLNNGKEWSSADAKNKNADEYLKNSPDGLSQKKREEILNFAGTALQPVKQKYGVEVNAEGRLVITNKILMDQKALSNAEDAVNETVGYMSEAMKNKATALEKLERLKTLKEYKSGNSAEFTAMYEALEAITGINEYNTPDQIEKMFDDLDKASEAYYKAKREDSRFAGRHGNGLERVQMSEDLRTYAETALNSLLEKRTESVETGKALSAQVASKVAYSAALTEARQNAQHAANPAENVNVNANENVNADANHRKMNVGEVRNMLKEGKVEPKGRKSVGAPKEKPVLEKKDEQVVKPQRKSKA